MGGVTVDQVLCLLPQALFFAAYPPWSPPPPILPLSTTSHSVDPLSLDPERSLETPIIVVGLESLTVGHVSASLTAVCRDIDILRTAYLNTLTQRRR